MVKKAVMVTLDENLLADVKRSGDLVLSALLNELLGDWLHRKEGKMADITTILQKKQEELAKLGSEVGEIEAQRLKIEAAGKLVPQSVVKWLSMAQQEPSIQEVRDFRNAYGLENHIVTCELVWKAWRLLHNELAVAV